MLLREHQTAICPRCGNPLWFGTKEESSNWKVFYVCHSSSGCGREWVRGRISITSIDTMTELYERAENLGYTFRNTHSETTADENVVHDDKEVIVDGMLRYIDSEASIPGDEAPFFTVFQESQREERSGFYCTNCGSVTDSIDGMGNVVCDNCGNVHRPDEWESRYL